MMKLLKSILFFPLLMFKGCAQLVLGIISGFSLLFCILFLITQNWVAATTTIIVGSVCLALRYGYAVLLIKLNPADTDLFVDI